ncbi:MAG: universal stress protein [Thermoanaerobaculia bacterium]|nr:universal stress protein [Thermoanaerobaculia bacterium]
MIRPRKLLYPTDFSRCARQALTHALFLAERFEAELHLLHAHVLHADDPANPERHFPESEELLRRLHEIAGSELARLLEAGRDRPIALREFQPRAISAATAILDHIDEHGIDLVVMGTHGRGRAARLLAGSVANQTIRSAPCPVLTLRERDEGRPIEAIDRIVAPLDFSRHTGPQLAWALELAQLYDARLQLLHVIERPVYPYFYSTLAGEQASERVAELEERTREALQDALAAAGGARGREVEVHVRRGRPASEIVAFARESSDMIALSTRGLSGVERLLLGSTAQEVVQTADQPVFLSRGAG